jgi:CRISPR-associated protein Cmx8
MLWSTYRGHDRAREVYRTRAARNALLFTENTWRALQKKREPGEISGSLLLGAEGKNAERVPLKGTLRKTSFSISPISPALFSSQGSF